MSQRHDKPKQMLLNVILDIPAGTAPVVYAISMYTGHTLYHSIELDCNQKMFEAELKWMREQYGVDPSRVRKAIREWQKNSGFSYVRYHPNDVEPVIVG